MQAFYEYSISIERTYFEYLTKKEIYYEDLFMLE